MKNKLKNVFYSIVAAGIILGSTFSFAQREPVPSDPKKQEQQVVVPGNKEKKTVKNKQIREGTPFLAKRVYFRQTGQRTMMFTTDGKENYLVLENLSLERILDAMDKKPDRGIWLADGEFTEFQGANYVLIQRAVAAPAGSPAPVN
ncbi:hypothetical protein FACS1894214_3290 [Planctomycetales bacterium]|nr:hypothetical protein FACS1894214_3290 [Planctomycetales bacterium]